MYVCCTWRWVGAHGVKHSDFYFFFCAIFFFGGFGDMTAVIMRCLLSLRGEICFFDWVPALQGPVRECLQGQHFVTESPWSIYFSVSPHFYFFFLRRGVFFFFLGRYGTGSPDIQNVLSLVPYG